MPEHDMKVDYRDHLGQSTVWPRMNNDGTFEQRQIHEMNQGHAINAFHVLVDWGRQVDYPQIKYTNLAQALLTQAVGEQVVFAVDTHLSASPPVDDRDLDMDSFSVHVDLEKCFDALAAVGDHEHPVTRARELMRALVNTP